MILTPEQQALLDGAKGEVMAKVVKTLVMYGDTFGAERMVPVSSKYGHTVISYGLNALGPVLNLFDQLIDAGLPADLVSEDLRDAIHHLSSVTGEITTDTILQTIFSRFCIGK